MENKVDSSDKEMPIVQPRLKIPKNNIVNKNYPFVNISYIVVISVFIHTRYAHFIYTYIEKIRREISMRIILLFFYLDKKKEF